MKIAKMMGQVPPHVIQCLALMMQDSREGGYTVDYPCEEVYGDVLQFVEPGDEFTVAQACRGGVEGAKTYLTVYGPVHVIHVGSSNGGGPIYIVCNDRLLQNICADAKKLICWPTFLSGAQAFAVIKTTEPKQSFGEILDDDQFAMVMGSGLLFTPLN